MNSKRSTHVVDRALRALLLAALVGGCAGLPSAQQESPNLYTLEARPIAKAAYPKRDLVLEVGAPHASPGFDTSQMAYVVRPYALDYFAKNRWADAPPRMLGPLLARALEQTGSFRAVVQAPSVVPADLRLNVDLIRLQQNFQARPSRIELTLRAQLIDVHGKRVLATGFFDEAETARSEDAYGGVSAANVALERILERVADFCVTGSDAR